MIAADPKGCALLVFADSSAASRTLFHPVRLLQISRGCQQAAACQLLPKPSCQPPASISPLLPSRACSVRECIFHIGS
jgi:hypothetical protein